MTPSIIPVHPDPVQIDRERLLEAKRLAEKELETLAESGLQLKRYVFFVPGWTGEDCACWLEPNTKRNVAIKTRMDRIFRNAGKLASYVDFVHESPQCYSFRDFGDVVRKKIGDRTPCDCVGHSMGGLDIAASVALSQPPLLNVRKFITFGSPLRGTELGGIRAKIGKLLPHIRAQAENMDPDHPHIKLLQSSPTLKLLLSRTEKIYCLYGGQDMAVGRSARIEFRDVDPGWRGAPPATFKEKVRGVLLEGATHTGSLGITQDPRAILWLVRILANLPLPEDKFNFGYLLKR